MGKIVLSYTIVLISHFFGYSILDPIMENADDTKIIYVGLSSFILILIISIILIIKLDWSKILGKIAPWTLDKDET